MLERRIVGGGGEREEDTGGAEGMGWSCAWEGEASVAMTSRIAGQEGDNLATLSPGAGTLFGFGTLAARKPWVES